jgi:hypothetical protein
MAENVKRGVGFGHKNWFLYPAKNLPTTIAPLM